MSFRSYMHIALYEARAAAARGEIPVGAVVVNATGQVVAQAGNRTRELNDPSAHAEMLAIRAACQRLGQERLANHDLYVTLEPCAHTGKTPPCAQALIDAQVARVVIACTDTDPRVSGQGIAMLQAAGITVEVGQSEGEARADHIGFFSKVDLGRPMVTLKLASSFDGRIATATGESQWITAGPARRLVHAMRARHDAVMVGGGTARKDDPSLNIRDLGIARQPARIVISKHLDLPLGGKLAQTAAQIPLLLCHARTADPQLIKAWQGIGATLIPCTTRAGQIDPHDLLQNLGTHGLTRIFCEGGGGLAATLLSAGLVDRLVGFTAGVTLGSDGLASIGPLGIRQLANAPRFTLASTQAIGPDVLHIWNRT